MISGRGEPKRWQAWLLLPAQCLTQLGGRRGQA